MALNERQKCFKVTKHSPTHYVQVIVMRCTSRLVLSNARVAALVRDEHRLDFDRLVVSGERYARPEVKDSLQMHS